jgi:hypothetical protein
LWPDRDRIAAKLCGLTKVFLRKISGSLAMAIFAAIRAYYLAIRAYYFCEPI